MSRLLLQRNWYWCGTLAPRFTADGSVPDSHSADVVSDDAAALAAAASVLLLGQDLFEQVQKTYCSAALS
jgi:hypothetical protein